MFRNLVLLVVASLCGAMSAHGALLGSGSFRAGFGASLNNVGPEPANVSFFLAGPSGGVALAMQTFSVGDPNFTATLTAGDTFAAIAGLLTNGADNQLWWSITTANQGGVSGGAQQSAFFLGSPAISLAGSFPVGSIDRIEFSIANMIATPGRDPNRDGQWVDFNFDIAMDVHGTAPVPEPGAMLLMLVGLTCVIGLKRSTNRAA